MRLQILAHGLLRGQISGKICNGYNGAYSLKFCRVCATNLLPFVCPYNQTETDFVTPAANFTAAMARGTVPER